MASLRPRMTSFGRGIGVALVVAAAACTARPLDPGTGGDTSTAPQHDAAPSVAGRDASTADPPRDAMDAIADNDARDALGSVDVSPADGPFRGDAQPDADGGPVRDGGLDGTTSKPRALTLVLDGAPWYASQATQGIAVDPAGRVYLQDSTAVYTVEGSTVAKYLTAGEAAVQGFGDMDIGPDGRLYIVASYPNTVSGFGIVRSSEPHVAEKWIDLSPPLMDVSKIAVIDDGEIAAVSRSGFWTFTDAGGRLVYGPSTQSWSPGCACEDLAAARSGVFLYQPGCNAYPILRGRTDGSGVGTLYNAAIGQVSEVSASNFTCVARDPAGGFYFIVQNVADYAPRLFHVTEGAQGASGLTLIDTVPSFAEAKKQASSTFGFLFCSLATGKDGAVYFQTYAQLWKVAAP